jgi:hypothetical protein
MKSLMYADDGTYSGVDEDDALDMDDEIVFMARFLGEKSTDLNNPEGVVEGIMEELEDIDPVSDSLLGYMYLFLSDGSLDQSAGSPLVEYIFNLTTTNTNGSKDYFDVYNFGSSLPSWTDYNISTEEDSYFQSPHYRRHFAENWKNEDDTLNNDFCPWEFVTGRAGSLLRTYQLDTDLGV